MAFLQKTEVAADATEPQDERFTGLLVPIWATMSAEQR